MACRWSAPDHSSSRLDAFSPPSSGSARSTPLAEVASAALTARRSPAPPSDAGSVSSVSSSRRPPSLVKAHLSGTLASSRRRSSVGTPHQPERRPSAASALDHLGDHLVTGEEISTAMLTHDPVLPSFRSPASLAQRRAAQVADVSALMALVASRKCSQEEATRRIVASIGEMHRAEALKAASTPAHRRARTAAAATQTPQPTPTPDSPLSPVDAEVARLLREAPEPEVCDASTSPHQAAAAEELRVARELACAREAEAEAARAQLAEAAQAAQAAADRETALAAEAAAFGAALKEREAMAQRAAAAALAQQERAAALEKQLAALAAEAEVEKAAAAAEAAAVAAEAVAKAKAQAKAAAEERAAAEGGRPPPNSRRRRRWSRRRR